MTIVWVTPTVPYPLRDGGTIRIYQLLKGLARRHRIHLLAMANGEESSRDIGKLRDICESVELFTTPAPPPRWSRAWCHARWKSVTGPNRLYYWKELHEHLGRLSRRVQPDVVLLETLKLADYRPFESQSFDGPRARDNVILSRQNYEPDVPRRTADVATNPKDWAISRTSVWLLQRVERRVARKFRFMTAVSEKDAQAFRRLAPWAEVAVVPNGADATLFSPVATSNGNGNPIVTVVGTMEYPPNRDAARFFCRSMWPLVRAGCPTARFRILGNAAAKHLSDLIGEPGVELCEPGDEIAAELGRATVVAVPIRAGSGTRVKILEALAAGKPVVTTTIGCEGLDVTPERDVIVCDEPAQFAARIVELLNNELLRYALSVNGRRLIEQRYNWTMAVDRLEAFCVHVAQHSQERIAAGSP